jgi:anti-sigma factor ChrR (cupin superfamily)
MSLASYIPQTRDVQVHRRLLDGGLDAARLDWSPLDPPGSAGISAAWLYTADETADGAEACVARYAPGAREDSRGYPGYELTLVLDGELHDDNGDVYQRGELIVEPPGRARRFTSPGGCAVLVVREKGPRAGTASARRPRPARPEVRRCLLPSGAAGAGPGFQQYVQPGREAVGAHWLYTGEQTGPGCAEAYVAQFGPGAHGDLHRHLGFEVLFVFEGELHNDNGDVYGPGALVVERPGSVHRVSSEHGCLVLVVREKRTVALAQDERPGDARFLMTARPAR